MTRERAYEIESIVIYKHLEKFRGCLASESDNCELDFDLGRIVEKMNCDLWRELKKEITEEVSE